VLFHAEKVQKLFRNMAEKNEIVWLGMESNPDVMNAFAEKLGVDTNQYSFGDIFGLNEDLLGMIPQPLLALILLFPSNAKVPQEAIKGDDSNSFFLHQPKALQDACGTIAMIHAISNNLDKVPLADGCLKTYIEANRGKSPAVRGSALASNADINAIHNSFVQNEDLNQTKHVEAGSTGHHFVCFMQVGQEVVEFDGCKDDLTHHMTIGEDTFLNVTAKIVQEKYLDPNPDIIDFVMISFAQTQ